MFLHKLAQKEGRPRGVEGHEMRGDRALTSARVEQTTTDTFLPVLTFETILKVAVTSPSDFKLWGEKILERFSLPYIGKNKQTKKNYYRVQIWL